MRASIALEPKSHCDSRMPITGLAQSRVSVSLGNQLCVDAERPENNTNLVLGPSIDRVPVKIAKVQTPEDDVEQKSL